MKPKTNYRKAPLAFAAGLFIFTGVASAQDTWTGVTDGNWSDSSNWADGVAPDPVAAGILTFSGTSNTTNMNDLADLVGTFAFTNASPGQSFAISGNPITLSANVSATASSGSGILDTISNDISLGTVTRNFTLGNLHSLSLSGIISGGPVAGITKAQPGILGLLGTANTFTGRISINAGTISFNTIGDTGVASSLGAGAANTVIQIAGTTTAGMLTNVGEGGTSNRQVQIGNGTTGNARASIINNGTGVLVFTNASFNFLNTAALINSSRTLELGGSNPGTNEIQGVIRNNVSGGTNALSARVAVFKTGVGQWTLSGLNEQTNNTVIDNGTLNINTLADAGVEQSLGRTTSVTIGGSVNNATLRYTGAGASTTLQPLIGSSGTGTGSATFLNDGTGPVTWNNATSFNFAAAAADAARSITLGGSYDGGVNDINGAIINNNEGGGVVAVIKTGPGTWRLNGANTYTGDTTVQGGKLILGPSANLADNSTVHLNTAGSRLELPEGVTDTAAGLMIDGVARSGSWGSSLSAAANKDDNFFSGTGILSVPAGTDFYTPWASSFGLQNPWLGVDPLLNGAPGADPDGDGKANRNEFIFGLNPTSGADASEIVAPLNQATGFFSYTRRVPVLSGATFRYEWSTTLTAPWTAFTPDAGTTSNDLSPVETIAVKVPAALLTNSRLFVRVSASFPEP
jgi:autotransporter-associated beta strand protein